MNQWRKFKKAFLTIHREEKSGHRLALGFAVGTLIAFTPTMGFQLILVTIIATLVQGNRAAAALAVFITNPFTLLPIYGLTFGVGNMLLPGRWQVHSSDVSAFITHVQQLSWTHFHSYIELFSLFDKRFWAALWTGGILVGAVAAFAAYWTVRYVRKWLRHHSAHSSTKESSYK